MSDKYTSICIVGDRVGVRLLKGDPDSMMVKAVVVQVSGGVSVPLAGGDVVIFAKGDSIQFPGVLSDDDILHIVPGGKVIAVLKK